MLDSVIELLYFVFFVFLSVALLFLIILAISEDFRKTLFAEFTSSKWMSEWFNILFLEHKMVHLNDFTEMKPENSTEKLKVLEVGVGEGTNFKLFPDNCVLTALEYNENFKTKFMENVKRFSRIQFDEFHTGDVEDMHQFDDNTFDVVLVTHVLCSVYDVPQALQEIKRVLKEGGKFFFVEHVAYHHECIANEFWSWIQFFIQPFWKIVMDGCMLSRSTWLDIEQAEFNTVTITHNYPINLPAIFRPHIWGCATK